MQLMSKLSAISCLWLVQNCRRIAISMYGYKDLRKMYELIDNCTHCKQFWTKRSRQIRNSQEMQKAMSGLVRMPRKTATLLPWKSQAGPLLWSSNLSISRGFLLLFGYDFLPYNQIDYIHPFLYLIQLYLYLYLLIFRNKIYISFFLIGEK